MIPVNGSCVAVSTCPSGSFASGNSNKSNDAIQCQPCHPDCSTCSGPSIYQCTSCSSTSPMTSLNLNTTTASVGRCLSACPSGWYLSSSTSTPKCTICDTSCTTCTGPGPQACSSCSGSSILQNGACTLANCTGGFPPVNSLSICLEALGTAVDKQTTVLSPSSGLKWWQLTIPGMVILLLLLLLGVLCWRKRMRSRRGDKTRRFSSRKSIHDLEQRQGPAGKSKRPAGSILLSRGLKPAPLDFAKDGGSTDKAAVLTSPRAERPLSASIMSFAGQLEDIPLTPLDSQRLPHLRPGPARKATLRSVQGTEIEEDEGTGSSDANPMTKVNKIRFADRRPSMVSETSLWSDSTIERPARHRWQLPARRSGPSEDHGTKGAHWWSRISFWGSY